MSVGRRIEFMLNLLMIITYLVLTHDTSKNIKISVKNKIYLLVGTPIVLTLLNYVSYKRDGLTKHSQGLFGSIQNFIFSQGVSSNILGYTYEYRHILPKNKIYSFGPLTEFLQNNYIYKFIFGGSTYIGQTEERALNGHLFAHTISFYIMPKAYLLGRGYGSSYIAELYYDFGYFGLFFFNIIIGILLYVLPKLFNSNSWLIGCFCLLFMRNILLIPRAEFISFISSSVTLVNLVGLFLIYVFSRFLEVIVKAS